MNNNQASPVAAISATRHEFKAVADGTLLADARMWLRLHPACFRLAYPRRQVNSLYFDTTDLDSFAENLAGISRRQKVRLRWYGTSERDITPILEVKCKRNKLGWKLSQRINQAFDLQQCSWRDLMAALKTALNPELRLYLDNGLLPVLLLRYWRDYFESFDGSTRITLDDGLIVYDQRHYSRPNLRFSTPIADELVIEFKAAAANSEALSAVIASVPFRITASSKYVKGILGVLGY